MYKRLPAFDRMLSKCKSKLHGSDCKVDWVSVLQKPEEPVKPQWIYLFKGRSTSSLLHFFFFFTFSSSSSLLLHFFFFKRQASPTYSRRFVAYDQQMSIRQQIGPHQLLSYCCYIQYPILQEYFKLNHPQFHWQILIW